MTFLAGFAVKALLRAGIGGGDPARARLISLKLLFGILIGGLITTAIWGWRVNTLRAKWQSQVNEITLVIREVVGDDKLKPAEAVRAVRRIGQDRDIARRERDSAARALATQTASVRSYEAETKRLRSISDKNVKLAAALVYQRDVWISRAKAAATRTERATCEIELEETEKVLDALYQNGL